MTHTLINKIQTGYMASGVLQQINKQPKRLHPPHLLLQLCIHFISLVYKSIKLYSKLYISKTKQPIKLASRGTAPRLPATCFRDPLLGLAPSSENLTFTPVENSLHGT